MSFGLAFRKNNANCILHFQSKLHYTFGNWWKPDWENILNFDSKGYSETVELANVECQGKHMMTCVVHICISNYVWYEIVSLAFFQIRLFSKLKHLLHSSCWKTTLGQLGVQKAKRHVRCKLTSLVGYMDATHNQKCNIGAFRLT